MIVETSKGKLPVRYGMNALARFGRQTGKSMNEVMECLGDLGNMQIDELLAFVYAGFIDGARWSEEECKIKSVDEIGDMIDEDDQLIDKVTTVFLGDDAKEDGGSKKK